ncbi:MAG: universal stress protein [Betaproteobacteria bacterium]|jgi:nucleotide-binding universal stress UspA family protein|nr:universal stress protein [Betaproteobacteria bacterium]
MYTNILLPTDGSKPAAKAIKQGIALAKSLGSKLTVLNVMPEFQMVIDEGFVIPNIDTLKKRFDEQTAKQARKIVDAVAADAKTARIKCDTIIDQDAHPYEAILKHAKKTKCDLIVMGSHGRTGLASILLGSETSKVLTHSKIPVLVVR